MLNSTACLDDRYAAGLVQKKRQSPLSQKAAQLNAMETSETLPTVSALQRIARGDASAVDDCLEQYGGLVWSLSRRYCRADADAEDAAQEIFVELWKNAGRFDPAKASEATFVSMIARRRLIDRHRRGQSSPDTVSIQESVFDVSRGSDIDRVELSDEAAKAAGCMEKLSTNQQEILTRSIHHCEPHASIAKTLKMPLGTVKSYARRGLLQLRECMERPANPGAVS